MISMGWLEHSKQFLFIFSLVRKCKVVILNAFCFSQNVPIRADVIEVIDSEDEELLARRQTTEQSVEM